MADAAHVSELLDAAFKGDVYRMGALLEKHEGGLTVNSADYDHRTALHLASSEGALECAKLLVKKNADINAKDRWNGTPLDDAVRSNNKDVMNYLVENGAKTGDERDVVKRLFAAIEKNDVDNVNTLIKSGVDVKSAVKFCTKQGALATFRRPPSMRLMREQQEHQQKNARTDIDESGTTEITEGEDIKRPKFGLFSDSWKNEDEPNNKNEGGRGTYAGAPTKLLQTIHRCSQRNTVQTKTAPFKAGKSVPSKVPHPKENGRHFSRRVHQNQCGQSIINRPNESRQCPAPKTRTYRIALEPTVACQ